jgi:glycosyltransferase involved in cell wall biosynthesis
LEDNEELILEANLGAPFDQLLTAADLQVPLNLSHPKRYREFLKEADAATVIMDRLGEFVPTKVPSVVLWPGADTNLFFPRAKDNDFLKRLGVAPGNLVLCYTGNVHSANAREVRSLYVAAAILNRQGMPTTLLRAGSDYCPFLGPDDTWARQISVNLGYINHVEVPSILALADYLIQPGTEGAFNDYRLPAKLPEFFAMGKPVLLPATNVGRFVQHGEHAWVLPKADAFNIVEALKTLRTDSSLTRRLASGALAFSQRHFNWRKNAMLLTGLYQNVLTNPLRNRQTEPAR